MTSNGHQNGQYYPRDPHFEHTDMDGRAQGYAQRNMASIDHGAGHPQQNQNGYGYQHYGQAAQYAQQSQTNVDTQQGYAGQTHQSAYGDQSLYGDGASAYQQRYATAQGYQPAYGHALYGHGQPTYGQTGQTYPGQPQGMQGAYVAPATSQPVQLKQKSRKPIVIAIIVALICIALAMTIFFFMQGNGASNRAGTKGQLEGKTDEEIQAELDRQVEEGMFNISIASVIEFADGASEGELRIENVPGNNYLMKVDITRDDTNETIYTTDLIEPDYHIQRDTLDVDLDQGTYPCTAVFTAYDPDTEDQIGQAAAKITVLVKG